MAPDSARAGADSGDDKSEREGRLGPQGHGGESGKGCGMIQIILSIGFECVSDRGLSSDLTSTKKLYTCSEF
jgi:hypothetical protein